MSRHDGVSCDACLKSNFKGRRYKCLICFDYDLCSSCYENGSTTNQHTTSHPMQCILTRHDFDIFHGGESLTADQPQSLTCPFCGKMGFTERTLQEHVTANHLDTACEVVCPICASVPGGDPNHVTDDFAAHLTLDHPSGAPRELDVAESGSRHGVRRVPHQGRGLNRGVARQNMRFGSVNSGFFSSTPRSDSMDPIAELLSQLSGVRRATASDLLSTADSHLEQASTRQQQLDRLPTRRSGVTSGGLSSAANNAQSHVGSGVPNGNVVGTGLSSSVNGNGPSVVGSTQGGVVVSLGANAASNVITTHHHHHQPQQQLAQPQQHVSSSSNSNKQHQNQSLFLLTRLGEMDIDGDDQWRRRSRANFVQDLMFATLSLMKLEPLVPFDIEACYRIPISEPPPPKSHHVGTQTSPPHSVPTTPTNNSLNTLLGLTGPPLTKTTSSSSVTLSGGVPQKGSKSQGKLVTRSSPVMQPPQSVVTFQSSNSGSGRVVVTGTGTVSVPPSLGPGRATGGAVSPGSGRRKPVRGVDGRSAQPPPPH